MSDILIIILVLSFICAFIALLNFNKNKTNSATKSKYKKILIATTSVFLISCVGAGASTYKALMPDKADTEKIQEQRETSNGDASPNKKKANKDSKNKKNSDKSKKNNDKTKLNTASKPSDKKSTNTFVEAKVVKVVDGDTIHVMINNKKEKVRFIGVDTPETVHPQKTVEYYGKEASNYTKSNLEGKTIYLQKDVSERDRYGRLLRYIWLSRPSSNEPSEQEVISQMFNAKLVREGYAHASTYQPDSKYSNIFVKLQDEAKTTSMGLWAKTPYTPSTASNTGSSYTPNYTPSYNYRPSTSSIYAKPNTNNASSNTNALNTNSNSSDNGSRKYNDDIVGTEYDKDNDIVSSGY